MMSDNKKELGIVGIILFSLLVPIDWLIMSFFDIFGGIVSISAPVLMIMGFRLFSNAFDKKKWRMAIVLTTIVYIIVLILTWYSFLSLNAYKSLIQDYELHPELFTNKPSYLRCFANPNDRFVELGSSDVSSLFETLLIALIIFVNYVFNFKRDIRILAQPTNPKPQESITNKLLSKNSGRIIVGLVSSFLSLTLFVLFLYLITKSERFAGFECVPILFIPTIVFKSLSVIIHGVVKKPMRTILIFITISVTLSIIAIVLTGVLLTGDWDEYTFYYPFYHNVNNYIFAIKQGLLCAILYSLIYPIFGIVENFALFNIKKVFTIDAFEDFCGRNVCEKKDHDEPTKEDNIETKTDLEENHSTK